ncbi:MAG: lipid-A-disaccharide synthase, partial [Parvibaculaceae bacterium]|nr:lipid-A-disaccharide synthase [Parvibaculaceae bacterium]
MSRHSEKPPHIMLVVGEASGDILGSALMTGLKDRLGDVRFSGVGGPKMEALGLASIFPMSDIAVMGPREIIPRLPLIFRHMKETAAHAEADKPDGIVIIDSPDFTHRVAKRIHKRMPDVPIANYVSPTVWAWRRGRAKAMAGYLDRVLALLPFEPDFFAAQANLKCVYVGHPAIEKVAPKSEGEAFRIRHGLSADTPLALILPGSRTNEVKRLSQLFGDTAQNLATKVPDLRVVIPTVPHVADYVREVVATWPGNPIVVEDDTEKRGAFAAANVALAASGTVALELGLAQIPMTIAYKIDRLAAWVVGRMMRVPSVVLVNLVLDRPSVNEFLQQFSTP